MARLKQFMSSNFCKGTWRIVIEAMTQPAALGCPDTQRSNKQQPGEGVSYVGAMMGASVAHASLRGGGLAEGLRVMMSPLFVPPHGRLACTKRLCGRSQPSPPSCFYGASAWPAPDRGIAAVVSGKPQIAQLGGGGPVLRAR